MEIDCSFYRSELRVLQGKCDGDNEKFLNIVAEKLQKDSEEIEKLRYDLGMAEHKVRLLENGENPTRKIPPFNILED